MPPHDAANVREAPGPPATADAARGSVVVLVALTGRTLTASSLPPPTLPPSFSCLRHEKDSSAAPARAHAPPPLPP